MNSWCNEETVIDYIESLIVPYMTQKRRQLGLDLKHTGLLMLDEFKGQTISRVLNLLQSNDLMYVIIPPNCTDRLQPLDVSVNRAAQFLQINLKTGMYADDIVAQKNIDKEIESVDMKLFIVKPTAAKWMMYLYSYLVSNPQIIKNCFKHVGITDFLVQ